MKEQEALNLTLTAYEMSLENRVDSKFQKQYNDLNARETLRLSIIETNNKETKENYKDTIQKSEDKRDAELETAEEKRDAAIKAANDKYEADIKKINYKYETDVKKAEKKQKEELASNETSTHVNRDYIRSEMNKITTASKQPDPERIIRVREKLRAIESKLDLAQRILRNFEMANAPGYVNQAPPTIIPKWIPKPEALEEERQLAQQRLAARLEDAAKTRAAELGL
jgi:uncharacterized membrane protein YqiK